MAAHKPIDTRQRDDRSGQLFRAYTADYRRAKHLRAARYTVSGALAVTAPVVSLWSLTAAGIVGALAGVWVLATRLAVLPAERVLVKSAVSTQELFDVRLFDLPWPSQLAGDEPGEEDISDAARRVQHDERVTRQLEEGWYPSTAGLPWPVDVLVAQWASAAYGRRQHGAYAKFVVAGTATVVAAAIAVGGATHMSLTDWLIVFLLPALPALLDVTDLAQAHRQLAVNKRDIEARIVSLWRNELDQPGVLTAGDCREVQDRVFRLRVQGLQIPDWYYWLERDRNEANMNDAAANRRAQYAAATEDN